MVSTVTLEEQERALREGAGFHLRKLDVVEVGGPDSESFLDGQLSQAVAAMSAGECRWSFVLQPQGKVIALMRVLRVGPESYLLVADQGWGHPVAERLERFRLRVNAEISVREATVVSVRGPESPTAPDGAIPSLWPGWPGWDHLDGDSSGEATSWEELVECGTAAWEAARIRAGLPVTGIDITEKTIPAESGVVELAADFDKGCYVGQELVARIDSRGRVNRHLRRLSCEPGPVPPRGSQLFEEGSERAVGEITSSAPSEVDGHGMALGYVRREVEPGSTVIAQWEGAVSKMLVVPDAS